MSSIAKKGRPKGSKNKPKQVINVGQQPNNPQIQQQFAGALNAKNVGVDKIILNVNGGNSELVTNRNAILKYSLKQPVMLETGDVITCVNAFVEEKGLAENTISFEEDVEAEMRFMYYKQGDCGDELTTMKDIGFVAYPKLFPDSFTTTASVGTGDDKVDRGALVGNYLGPPQLYENLVGDLGPNMNFSGVNYGVAQGSETSDEKNITTGCNGNYYYLMETVRYNKSVGTTTREFSGEGQNFLRPVYGSKTVKITAGNYSVDSLANIISSQLNGSLGQGNNSFSDALLDKLYNTNGVNKNNFFRTTPYFKDIDSTVDSTQSDIIGTTGERNGFERSVDGFVKQINYSDSSYYESWAMQNMFAFNDPADRLQATGEEAKFPNNETTFKKTSGFNGNPPEYTTLLAPNTLASDGSNHNHFYLNRKAMGALFENENNQFYSLAGLKNNSENPDNLFFPPFVDNILYNTVDLDHGYIPTVTTNAAIPGNPYQNLRRFVGGPVALNCQMIWPIKALTYPGDGSLDMQRQKFAGTSVAQLTFGDAVSNRFALSNFHEFLKLPNLDAAGTTTTGFGGQQATKFNNPYYNDLSNGGASTNINTATADAAATVYPVDSTSGVAINNFDFALVKNTQVYKDLVTEIQSIDGATAPLQQLLHKEKLIFDLFTKPFDKFFATSDDAQNAWTKSLWFRLGFSYNQLGNISNRLESFVPPGGTGVEKKTMKQKGIITHNGFDFSKIVSSDGLGLGNPTIDSGTPMQNFRLTSYFPGTDLPSNLGTSGNNIHILGDSKPISAENLPSLNAGKSYLIIESDLIKPNYKDTKANLGNLLAIMSKENATNDTIFGADPIDFTVTEPRLLSDITIYIKNPDGTLAADDVVGKNNGFIIQIAKAIPVQKLPSVEI